MEVEEYEYGWRARQYSRFETAIESVRREVKEKEDCNLTTGRCVSLGDAVPRVSAIGGVQGGVTHVLVLHHLPHMSNKLDQLPPAFFSFS